MIGAVIVLGDHEILDPLTDDCRNGVSYEDVQIRPVKDLGPHFGNFWRWPSLPADTLAYGWVRCAGTNVGAFAFVDARHGYRFYEDGLVLQLQ